MDDIFSFIQFRPGSLHSMSLIKKGGANPCHFFVQSFSDMGTFIRD